MSCASGEEDIAAIFNAGSSRGHIGSDVIAGTLRSDDGGQRMTMTSGVSSHVSVSLQEWMRVADGNKITMSGL
jgi:hypothetical protein